MPDCIIEKFSAELKVALVRDLPGMEAQFKMAPEGRKQNYPDLSRLTGYKESAVGIHFYEKNNRICFPIIERVESSGVHSKQLALPGGKMDPMDEDFISCAIRETFEETGINIRRNLVLGKLTPLYIPPSNYWVQPVVSYQPDIPSILINETEVLQVFEFYLPELLKDDIIIHRIIKDNRGNDRVVPGFQLEGKLIWGATAMILSELKALIQSTKELIQFFE